jgi:hypothetical protein
MFFVFTNRIGWCPGLGNDLSNHISNAVNILYGVEKLLTHLLEVSAIIDCLLADRAQGDWYPAIVFK